MTIFHHNLSCDKLISYVEPKTEKEENKIKKWEIWEAAISIEVRTRGKDEDITETTTK